MHIAFDCTGAEPWSRPYADVPRNAGRPEAQRGRHPGQPADAGGNHPIGPAGHDCFYRALAESAVDVVLAVDELRTVVYNSPSTQADLGYRPGDVLGHDLLEFVHPDDVAAVGAALDECGRQDGASARVEHRLRHADGRWRSVESVCRFQSWGPGIRVGVVQSHDVTARKLLEGQALRSQKLEAVGLTTCAIAHDFNNMLVIMAGCVESLEDHGSSTVREIAQDLRLITDRAAALTGQLLSFARTTETEAPVCDANDVIAGFRPILNRLVGRAVRVSYSLDAVRGGVSLSRSALDQVLINLVVNARDAMPAGGNLIVTTATEWWPAAAVGPTVEYLVLSIADTGIGMTDDVKARAFEPFFTTKGAGRGSGIGLQTVHRMVTKAGGRINVISAPGLGTLVRVLLPVDPGVRT
ncbi:MAG: nitrogen regulation protein NR(II) [Vicinamibacterales bacterium]